MRVLFGLLAFAVLGSAAMASSTEHDAPFFPERMRTAMQWGMNARQVQAREGRAPRALGPSQSGRTALAYTTSIGSNSCVEQRTFVFRRGRLEAIDVLSGC
jgi:hypothetical protein